MKPIIEIIGTIIGDKTQGKRPLERARRRWVYDIKIDLREIKFGFMDCIDLAEDRDPWRNLVNKVMSLRVR
jgi:hypothetical protein